MKYQANPVVVDAFVITEVGKANADCSVDVKLDNGETEIATSEMMSRMVPKVGDYWVVQSDDYVYLNPKEVFERKYSPKEMDALELGAAVRQAGLAGQ